jgi:hypothetical protein
VVTNELAAESYLPAREYPENQYSGWRRASTSTLAFLGRDIFPSMAKYCQQSKVLEMLKAAQAILTRLKGIMAYFT